jgi:hypothetical protein
MLVNVVDEHTREALAMRVGRRCDADHVVAIIETFVAQRSAPGHLRVDDGPELVAPRPRASSRARYGRTR